MEMQMSRKASWGFSGDSYSCGYLCQLRDMTADKGSSEVDRCVLSMAAQAIAGLRVYNTAGKA